MTSEKYLPVITLALVLGISFSMNLSSESSHITDVIHPHSTVITDVGIATPKIAEIRMVDPGNASDIQAKINDCPSGGCRIYIPAGNYTITNTIVINGSRDNIILTGAASGHHQSDGAPTFIHGANNTNIINIIGNASDRVDNILIENIYFKSDHSKRGYVIYAENTSEYGLKVINNFFQSFYDPAIALKNSQGFFADHNTFYNCGDTVEETFAIEYLDASPNNNSFAQIVNNLFEIFQYGAINAGYTNSSYIAGNWMEGGEYGIRAGNNARVIGNYLYFPDQRGITSVYKDVIIKGNIVSTSTSTPDSKAISVRGGTVIGNVIQGGSYGGIWVNGSQARIVGNSIRGSGNNSALTGGIVLINSNYSIVSNNVVREGATNSSGIVIINNSNNNVIIGNSVTDFTNGIYESISGYGNNTIANNLVVNNTNEIVTSGNNTEIHKNMGYLTENGGISSVANGDSIAHGLVSTPSYYVLTPTVVNRSIAVTSANSTHLAIGLYNTNGTAITSAENVSWYAEV